jgi:hypothetical protein
MKIRFTILLSLITLISFSQNTTVSWKKRLYSSIAANINSIHQVNDLLVVNASFQGNMLFAGKTYTASSYSSIILIYDTSGTEKYAIQIEGTNIHFNTRIDKQSKIILYGLFGTFGSGYIKFKGNTINSNGVYDYFVAKIDIFGNHEWIQTIVSAGDEEIIDGVDIDANSNIYIVGWYGDSMSFNSGIKLKYFNNYHRNGFIIKLDTSGNVIRANQGIPLTATGVANLISVKVYNDRIYCLGTINFLTKIGDDTIKTLSSTTLPLWMYELDTSCNFISIKTIATLPRPGGELDFHNVLMESFTNSLLIAGSFELKLTFGTTVLTSGALDYSPFMAKVSTGGQNILAKQYTTSHIGGNSGGAYISGIQKQPNGSLTIAGGFDASAVSIEGSPYVTKGGNDHFIVEYDTSMNMKSIKVFETPNNDLLNSPILNYNDSYYAGSTTPVNHMIIFDNDTVFTANDNPQGFIVKYAHPFSIHDPVNLVATASGMSKINLSWTDNSSNEDRFIIQRSVNDSNAFNTIDSVNANITTYQNTGLLPGTKYYYRIFGKTADFRSAYSNYASATTGVGLNDSRSSAYITAYPNPFKNELILKSTVNLSGYSIYNMMGELILNEKTEPVQYLEINTVSIPAGVYILKSTYDDGIDYRKIIVKQ